MSRSFYDGGFYRQRERSGFYGPARHGGAPPSGDPAASIFARYGTAGILLGDLNPARLMPSGLSPSYLESTGLTAAGTSGQTLGLLLSRDSGAALGAELVTNGGFGADASWTKGANWAIAAGVATHTAGSTASLSQNVGLVAGRFYRLTGTVSGRTAGNVRPFMSGGAGATVGVNGAFSQIILCSGGDGTLYFAPTTDFDGSIDNITVSQVSGNHLYQATSADEPTLVNENGIWRVRGDGLTKNFLTPLAPAASLTGIVAGEANAVSDTLFGASVGTAFFKLATGADGKLRGFIGTTAFDITAASIVDVPGVGAIRGSGTSYYGFWQPLSGGAPETVSGTFAGSIPTTQPIRILSENDDGTSASPSDGDIARGVIQQAAWTDAEIAAVANQYRAAMVGW